MIERKIKISAPINVVFKVIRDFASYPEFLTTTEEAKERKLKSGIHVDFTLQVIKSINYTLKFDIEEPNKVEWTLVKGDLMKKNSGSWHLTKISDNITEAIYRIDVDFGWLVPKMIVEQLTKTQLPETLDAFKKRAEQLARERV